MKCHHVDEAVRAGSWSLFFPPLPGMQIPPWPQDSACVSVTTICPGGFFQSPVLPSKPWATDIVQLSPHKWCKRLQRQLYQRGAWHIVSALVTITNTSTTTGGITVFRPQIPIPGHGSFFKEKLHPEWHVTVHSKKYERSRNSKQNSCFFRWKYTEVYPSWHSLENRPFGSQSLIIQLNPILTHLQKC